MLSNYKIIAANKLDIEQLQKHFKRSDTFETNDIFVFYRHSEPDAISATLNWRIYTLVQNGVLERVSKGKFKLGTGKIWQPEISSKTISLYKRLKNDFPFLKICIWDTSVINEFMIHQPFRFYILVEVEKEAVEPVFFSLKDAKFQVAMEPTQDFLEKYITLEKDAIIVKPLVSEAPLQNIHGILSPAIEKLLVDIYCDDIIFAAQQGSEMRTIFNEAFNKYSVYKDRILRYANRRRKKEQLASYLENLSNYRQQS